MHILKIQLKAFPHAFSPDLRYRLDFCLAVFLLLSWPLLTLVLLALPLLDKHPVFLNLLLQFEDFDVNGLQLRVKLLVLNDLLINFFRYFILSANGLLHRCNQIQKVLHWVQVKVMHFSA